MNFFKTLALVLIALPLAAQNINWNQIRNRPWVSATDYGARCNGSTDDSTALQAAVDAVDNTGGVVLMPSGTCILGTTITLSSNIEVKGNAKPDRWRGGQSGTKINFTGTTAVFKAQPSAGTGIANVKLSQLYLTTSQSNVDGVFLDASAAGVTYIENVTLEDVSIQDFRYAIHSKGTVFGVSLRSFSASGMTSDCIRIDTDNSGAGVPSQWYLYDPWIINDVSGAWAIKVIGAGSLSNLAIVAGTISSGISGANGIFTIGHLFVSGTTMEGVGDTGVGIRYRGTNGLHFYGFLHSWATGIQIGDPDSKASQATSSAIAGTATGNGTADIHIVDGGVRSNTKLFFTGPTPTIVNDRESTDGDYDDVINWTTAGLLDLRGSSLTTRDTVTAGVVNVAAPTGVDSVFTITPVSGQTADPFNIKDTGGTIRTKCFSNGECQILRLDIGSSYLGTERLNLVGNVFVNPATDGGFRLQEAAGTSFWFSTLTTARVGLGGTGGTAPTSHKIEFDTNRLFLSAINSGPDYADLAASQIVLALDETGHNLEIYSKYANGATTRKGVVSLSAASTPITFATLPAVTTGSPYYCSDCAVTSSSDNTCAGSGTGALAIRLNSIWRCFDSQATASTPTALLQVAENAADNRLAKSVGTSGRTMEATGVTVDDSNNISTAGSISSGVGGSVAGGFEMTQGTLPTPAANSIVINAPTSVSTAYQFTLPGAAATGFRYGTNSSNVVTETFVAAASSSEVTTGTDASKPVTPDALAGSLTFGVKVVQIEIFPAGTAASTGDGKAYLYIPAALNGMNLISITGQVYTVGTTGTLNVDIARCATVATGNVCSGTVVDVLSTNLTIDSNEDDSGTAATAAVIDTSNDDVATGQVYRIDVDAVHTTPSQGLLIVLTFQLP